jgi:lactoylglutathione lyase
MSTSTPATPLTTSQGTQATQGWKFNQIGLRVASLDKSLSFYTTILGMTEIVRLPMDTATIALLGYPAPAPQHDGGKGGLDAGMSALLRREGVLELVQPHSKPPRPPLTCAEQEHHPDLGLGLVKLCFTVPDLAGAMARFRDFHVEVVQEPGTMDGVEVIARAIGIAEPSTGEGNANAALWDMVKGIGFVKDPDGYLVEVVQY